MARQESYIKLKGKIGDLTFFKTRNGYQAREAKGIDPSRIANDPRFQRTRENGAEFGRAIAAGKLLRRAVRPIILMDADTGMPNRLTGRMSRISREDAVNDRGERQVLGDNIGLLKGFNFNGAATLENTLFVDPTCTIDRATGALQVQVPALDPKTRLLFPTGTTHFQFQAAGVSIDFAAGTQQLEVSEGDVLPIGTPAAETVLNVALPEATTAPILLVFGIDFLQEVKNGNVFPLQNGVFNVLTILEVNGA